MPGSPTRIVASDGAVAPGVTVTGADPDPYPLAPGRSDRPLFVYLSASGAARFVNRGTIVATLGGSVSGWLEGFGVAAGSVVAPTSLFDNAIGASFMVDSRWTDPSGDPTLGLTAGFAAPGAIIAFANEGAFDVRAASGDAFGVWSGTAPIVFSNSGALTVTSEYRAIGAWGPSASGFDNGGSIVVAGAAFAEAVHFDQATLPLLLNRGTIRATTGAQSAHPSIGLFFGEQSAPAGGAFVIDNSGTIDADVAIRVEDGATAALISDVVRNSGSILGDVSLGFGDDVVDNLGLMTGRIELGAGSDRYDGAGGRSDGSVEGGPGDDRLGGGNGAEVLYGDGGDDSIFGGAGDDYIEGGWGRDRLDGGSGSDTLSYALSPTGVSVSLATNLAFDGGAWDRLSGFERLVGSRSADVLIADGRGDVIRGLGGDDRIAGGGGNDSLRGDGGADLLSGGGGNDLFLFQVGDGQDVVTDFTAGDRVQIYGYGAAQSLQQVGTSVVLTLSSNDRIAFANCALAVVQAGLSFNAGIIDMPVIRDEAIVALDEQFVIGAGVTLRLSDPQAATFGNDAHDVGMLLASTGATPRLYNAGTFEVTWQASPASVTAVEGVRHALPDPAADVTNRPGAAITVRSAFGDAVGVAGVGNLWNAGRIAVVASAANGFGVVDVTGQFDNRGTIDVVAGLQASGIARGTGTGPTSLYNSGSITVAGQGSSIGIDWQARPGNVLVNSGAILVGDASNAVDSVGVRLDWLGAASLWNSGSISGDFALRRAGEAPAGAGAQLAIYNSGQLIGAVDLTSPEAADRQSVLFISSGDVRGDVTLGGGDDLFDGRAGLLEGVLAGGAGNDQLLAGAGSQAIDGGAGEDRLSGGAGDDVLTGGRGADMFRFEAGFGNDRVTDFNPAEGDRIEVRGYAGWTGLIQQGTEVVVIFAPGEALVLSRQLIANVTPDLFRFDAPALADHPLPTAPSAEAAPTAPAAPQRPRVHVGLDGDFNGDGRADILWRSDAGVVGNWLGQANGGFVVNDGAALRSVDLAWHIDGRGDFNGDGRDDIIWRNDNGQLGTWTGNTSGGFTINDGAALQSVPVSWHVVGTGDFNGDGKSDLLWRNDNGAMGTWSGTAASGFVINQSTVRVIDGSWHIVATGDFNGDRIADILWRNDNGLLGTWSGSASASGGFTINDGAALQTASGDWNIVGAADVNGDGRSDILWRNDDGTVADWLANASGGFIVNSASAQAVPVSWQLASAGDYNGDHRADLLWTNDNGALTDWLGQANGTFVSNDGNLSLTVATAWQVQPVLDIV